MYHRASRTGVGYDRTTATGSGFAAQYPPALARLYENIATCPEPLLLFFHHVPYDHALRSGATVIEHIYASRRQGVWRARALRDLWLSLRDEIDPVRFNRIMDKFDQQVAHAIVWRDALTQFFHELSGVAPAPPTER